MEWLTTAPAFREPKTQGALAEELGVSARTLRDWQARSDVLRAWERKALEVAGSPERTQRIMDAMYELAMDATSSKQVQAAKLWKEMSDAIKPPKPKEEAVGSVLDLSLEELEAEIAREAARELERRKQADLSSVPLRSAP